MIGPTDLGFLKWLEKVAKFQWILVYGGQYNFIFSPKFCFLFQPFQVKWKTHVVRFLKKVFNQFENCLRIMIKVLEIYQKVCGMNGGCCTTSFSRWKMLKGKTAKKTLEYNIIHPIFIKFSPMTTSLQQ